MCTSLYEFILCAHTYSHRKREEKKKVNRTYACMHMYMYIYTYIYCMAVDYIVPSNIHFLYEFFTAQLNITDNRVFDIDLYLENRMRQRWNRFVIDRWDSRYDDDYCIKKSLRIYKFEFVNVSSIEMKNWQAGKDNMRQRDII